MKGIIIIVVKMNRIIIAAKMNHISIAPKANPIIIPIIMNIANMETFTCQYPFSH
jgi:hypothetical protein